MNVHKNAKLTPKGREHMVQLVMSGQTPQAASRAVGVCPRTVHKWVERFKSGGLSGLEDRSSRPKRVRNPTRAVTVEKIIALRRQRLTGKHIAREVGVSRSTVSRILKAAKLSRARDLEPAELIKRYERAAPGELIHLDIKRLGRFLRPGHRVAGDRTGQSTPRSGKKKGYGWEYVHVCIDDHSRVTYTDISSNEKAVSAVAHLTAAVAYYKKFGVIVTRVMTDNGSCYKSHAFANACKKLKLKHIRTKPYTPKTNGKAERFIQTTLREWAHARSYETSDKRAEHLRLWEHMYNWHRPHGGINDQTPISRLQLKQNNILRHHS